VLASHDAITAPLPAIINNRQDVWTDVKTPGDGRTYLVGTVNAESTDPMSVPLPTFSAIAGIPGSGAITSTPATNPPVTALRQVAVVQCRDAAGGVVWQRCYHGSTTGIGNGLSTCARAISVFPGTDLTGAFSPAETRIAICGETFDANVPNGPVTGNPNTSQTAGFVAVLEGAAGEVLWSYLLWGGGTGSVPGQCMVTDVSIRIEGTAPNQIDVVTYCGASAFGQASAGAVGNIRPFAPPPPWPGSLDNPAGGATHNGDGSNGSGAWDGLVGRLVAGHSLPVTPPISPVFQSTVGGGHQDALFGIAEIDADHFVVVGETADPVLLGPSSNFTFPLTADYILLAVGSRYQVDPVMGVILLFDTTLTRLPPNPPTNPNNLTLVASRLIGTVPPGLTEQTGQTCARDVAVVGDRIWVVGVTRDPGLPVAFAFQPFLQGLQDGFVACTPVALLNSIGFLEMSYYGSAQDDGLTAVSVWSESPDHAVVAGYLGPPATCDIAVASLWLDSTLPGTPLTLIREVFTTAEPGGREAPGYLGSVNATAGSPTYYAPLVPGNVYLGGVITGGGLAVDSRFRVHIAAGTTAGVPEVGGGRAYDTRLDGLRLVVDMVPAGVCRTDLTGLCAGAPVPSGVGTTTPVCALSLFGRLIGQPASAPLDRILIDFQGSNYPGSGDVALLLDRTPPAFAYGGSFLQLGFYSGTPLVQDQVELWTLNNPLFFALGAPGAASIRFPMGMLPQTGGTVTAQFSCFLSQPLACTGAALLASPALTFTW
jgi:hypothetical protein